MRLPSGFLGGRGQIWPAVTREAKRLRRPSHVAVAYFGRGADRLLPLRSGSHLVVDASDAAVKAGQTYPWSLAKLQNTGVLIYSRAGLHAKVFVFGNVAYVGSTNVSKKSSGHLIEALVFTKERTVVASARQFVRDNCRKSLGPEDITRLKKIYRPPVWESGEFTREESNEADSGLRIVRLTNFDPPPEYEAAYTRGERVARREIASTLTHTTYDFHWARVHSFIKGERVLPIYTDANGRTTVGPPGTVVHFEKPQKRSKGTIIFLEVPKRRPIELGIAATRLGRGATRKLKFSRRLTGDVLVDRVYELFQPRIEGSRER
jgi:hypothetical protein